MWYIFCLLIFQNSRVAATPGNSLKLLERNLPPEKYSSKMQNLRENSWKIIFEMLLTFHGSTMQSHWSTISILICRGAFYNNLDSILLNFLSGGKPPKPHVSLFQWCIHSTTWYLGGFHYCSTVLTPGSLEIARVVGKIYVYIM